MNEDTKQQKQQGNGVLPCVSEWRWFNAILKSKNGDIVEYSSQTKGNLEDAKEQCAHTFLDEVVEVVSIAFR